MKIDDEYIIEQFWSGKQSVLKRYVNGGKVNDSIINYLKNRFDDTENIYESLYRIKYGLSGPPKCPICDAPISFTNGYNAYCSRACANRNPIRIIHTKEAFAEKRKANPQDNLSKAEKQMQTKLMRYGDENYNNKKKSAKTKLDRYGDINYNNREKYLQTKIDRYGSTSYYNIDKAKATRLKRYGNENYCNIDKIRQTCLERYGVTSTLSIYRDMSKHCSKESRNKAVETSIKNFGKDNYNNRSLYKETCLDRYGVEHYSQTDDFKEAVSKAMLSDDVQRRRCETMLKNCKSQASKQEDMCFDMLSTIYNDIVRQYRSNKYKFRCDFYIPSEDLYIEFQGTWTHGGHPYIGNDEDLKKREQWHSKVDNGHLYYKNAIYTWTDLDIRKRNMAKSNNLNYIEFWKLSEVVDYIEKYKENIK